jgi:hypothetical protein
VVGAEGACVSGDKVGFIHAGELIGRSPVGKAVVEVDVADRLHVLLEVDKHPLWQGQGRLEGEV